MLNKKSYFQGGGGVNEPTPGHKKYKSDPALVVQPRFKEPFYRNYDLYDVPGEHGPGAGWHEVTKHPSIKEFLEFRRKRLKDKYKADDSWILDSGEKTKKNPNIKVRAGLLSQIVKIARVSDLFSKLGRQDSNNIDFPIDEEVNKDGEMIYPSEESYHPPMLVGPDGVGGNLQSYPSDTGPTDFSSYINSVDIGGEHTYLPKPDFEGKSSDALDFGRDYTEDDMPNNLSDDELQKLMNKYLSPSEGELFGLPDGIDPNSDLDAEETINDDNPDYGITDSGEQMYDDKWNI